MSETEFDRTARAWLDDGPTEISDRVLLAALDEVHLTHQRRSWWPARRFSNMTNLMRAAAVTAAVVAIGVAAYSLAPGDLGRGGEPTATPTPIETSAATPAATLRVLRILPFREATFALHLTVPEGWTYGGNFFVIQKYGGDLPEGMAIAVWTVDNVYGNGCRWDGSLLDPRVGPGVEDLANALTYLTDRETTQPVDVEVDGYPGMELEMTIPDVAFETCDQGEFRSWVDDAGGARFHQGPLEHSRIIILDVDGTRVLVSGRSFPGSTPADVAELNEILDTMEFGPPE